jgi:hypothetical protein
MSCFGLLPKERRNKTIHSGAGKFVALLTKIVYAWTNQEHMHVFPVDIYVFAVMMQMQSTVVQNAHCAGHMFLSAN